MHIKTEDLYEDIATDVEERFDTSNYTVDRPLPIDKNKKVSSKFKDELGGKIMTRFVGLRPKKYSYLKEDDDDDNEVKKAKGTKKWVVKRVIKFNDFKDCLLEKKTVLKSQQRFKSDKHVVYTEEVNKAALNSNDDKILWASDRITSYPYGYKGNYAKRLAK